VLDLTISLVFFSDWENSKCVLKKTIFQELQSLGGDTRVTMEVPPAAKFGETFVFEDGLEMQQ